MSILIEHIDPDGKVWEIPYFEAEDLDNIAQEAIFDSEMKSGIFNAIYDSLVILHQDNVYAVPSFSVNEYIFEINKDNCQENIETSIRYFEEIEEFEKCAKLQNLQK